MGDWVNVISRLAGPNGILNPAFQVIKAGPGLIASVDAANKQYVLSTNQAAKTVFWNGNAIGGTGDSNAYQAVAILHPADIAGVSAVTLHGNMWANTNPGTPGSVGPPLWTATTSYSLHNIVQNMAGSAGSPVSYVAIAPGTSGSSPPTGLGSLIPDGSGGLEWRAATASITLYDLTTLTTIQTVTWAYTLPYALSTLITNVEFTIDVTSFILPSFGSNPHGYLCAMTGDPNDTQAFTFGQSSLCELLLA